MSCWQPMLLALHEQRDLAPLERPVGVAKGAGAVLLAFRRTDALGVAVVQGLLDLGADFFLGCVAQTITAALLETLDQRMDIDAVCLEQTLQSEYGGDDFAVTGRGQPADDIPQPRAAPVVVATTNKLERERQGSPPAAGVVSANAASPILGIVEAARQ